MIASNSDLHISPPTRHIPVFRDPEGNKFVLPYKDFVMESPLDARSKGVEALFNFLLSGITSIRVVGVMEFDNELEVPNFVAKFGQWTVAVISGPAFDKQMAVWEAREADKKVYESEVKRATERGD